MTTMMTRTLTTTPVVASMHVLCNNDDNNVNDDADNNYDCDVHRVTRKPATSLTTATTKATATATPITKTEAGLQVDPTFSFW